MVGDYRLVEDKDGLILMSHVIDPPNGKRRWVGTSCLAGSSMASIQEQFSGWQKAMNQPVLLVADFENAEDLE